jgi:hypothetical protein
MSVYEGCDSGDYLEFDEIWINETMQEMYYSGYAGDLITHTPSFDIDDVDPTGLCINGSFSINYLCNFTILNLTNSELINNITLGPFGIVGYCTTTSTTTTTTTSTTEATTTSSSTSSSSSSSTTLTPTSYTTTSFGYSIPHGNHGTLPTLNGTGGITINNGSLKNMSCTGNCIIGLKKEEFQLYAAVMIIIIVLISIKPFKSGATASAVALLFFNNILGWTTITTSLMLIFVFIALATWWLEGKQ